jgi:hypothetical protein
MTEINVFSTKYGRGGERKKQCGERKKQCGERKKQCGEQFVGPVGIEPTTHRLKVCCSTD